MGKFQTDVKTEWILESLLQSHAQAGAELDRTVGFLIHQARSQYGWSWSEIGELLGTNRESARQRYVRWRKNHF